MARVAKNKKLTIGLDLDDTIIDHRKNRHILSKKLHLPANHKDLKKILYAEMSVTAKPMKNAVDIIKKIIKMGYKVVIISRRRRDGQVPARKWLRTNLPEISPRKIFFVEEDKDKNLVCQKEKVDVFIDDSSEVLSPLDSNITKILFTKNWRKIEKIITKSAQSHFYHRGGK